MICSASLCNPLCLHQARQELLIHYHVHLRSPLPRWPNLPLQWWAVWPSGSHFTLPQSQCSCHGPKSTNDGTALLDSSLPLVLRNPQCQGYPGQHPIPHAFLRGYFIHVGYILFLLLHSLLGPETSSVIFTLADVNLLSLCCCPTGFCKCSRYRMPPAQCPGIPLVLPILYRPPLPRTLNPGDHRLPPP